MDLEKQKLRVGCTSCLKWGLLGASKSTKGTCPATKVLTMHLKHLVLSGLEDDKTYSKDNSSGGPFVKTLQQIR